MSKHFFQTQGPGLPPLAVDVGWDRPCGHFYLNVEAPSLPEEKQAVYISMYDKRTFETGRPRHLRGGLSLEEVKTRMEELCLTPPDGLLEALAEDQACNTGNSIRHW